MAFLWRLFEFSFQLSCILLTIVMVCAGFYKFSLDEDATVVAFKTFYETPTDIYPSVSICFTSPFEEEKLKAFGNNITLKDYSDFIKGSLKNI